MAFQAPDQPAAPTNGGARVACDDLLALGASYERHAREAGAGKAVALLDQVPRREVEDVEKLETLTCGTAEVQAVRQWLADAWRHGEVVMDADGCQPATVARSVDRFAVSAPGAPPSAEGMAGPSLAGVHGEEVAG